MLSYIVTASINDVKNLKPLNSAKQENLKVLVIDEGNVKLRKKNNGHLKDVPHEYFGPRERREWFKSRVGALPTGSMHASDSIKRYRCS